MELCLLCVLTGCFSQIPLTTKSTLTATPESIVSVRPGVILTNEYSDLTLPTSGYDVYVIGEAHGEREIHELTCKYLEALYYNSGVRTVIIEQISPVDTPHVNAYVLGASDILSSEWSHPADILTNISKFNDDLPMEEKVRVYLPDLDFLFSKIYKHLLLLHKNAASDDEELQIPSFAELGSWDEEELLVLVSRLVEVAGDHDDIIADLATVADSIRFHFISNQIDYGKIIASEYSSYGYIREARIAQNVQRLLDNSHDKPVLALYGGYHAQKYPALTVSVFNKDPFLLDSSSWVQRTIEAGVDVYSVLAIGITGQAGLPGYVESVEINADEIRFSDGVTSAGLFSDNADNNIMYIDLRVEENQNLRLRNDFIDLPAGQIYDGVVLFREVHPLEWEQYP